MKDLKYKNYVGRAELDVEAGVLHGYVLNLKDVITFEGRSVEDLVRAFHDSVDVYLDFCAEQGREPEKPPSGKLVIRMEPELHRQIRQEAAVSRMSMNEWLKSAAIQKLASVQGKNESRPPRGRSGHARKGHEDARR